MPGEPGACFIMRGVPSRREFEHGLRTQAEPERNVLETQATIVDTERMLTEAHMTGAFARLVPLPRGRYEEAPGLARFNGLGPWSVARDTAQLQQFFAARFGHALPISAFGQTRLPPAWASTIATRWTIHPDSPEGRTFMEFLRAAGIPFIAAWGPIPGSASGAHIHVGQPSPRLTGKR